VHPDTATAPERKVERARPRAQQDTSTDGLDNPWTIKSVNVAAPEDGRAPVIGGILKREI